MIPDEAVEAAAELIATVDYPGYRPDLEFAREVLEAAAPHMLAQAWDEGFSAGEDVGNWYAAPVTKQPVHTNPYRSHA